jgi:hypothetical protein
MRSWYGEDVLTSNDSLFTPIILESLEKAVKVSIENIPMLMNQDVLIAADVSGSMQTTISEKSTIQNYDIGLLLGMLVQSKTNNSVLGMFGDNWKPLTDVKVHNTLAATNEIHGREGEVGYQTRGYKVLDWAINQKRVFSRILFFTDGQMYGYSNDLKTIDQKWKKYKSTVNPDAKLYLFNLGSYGQTPIDLKTNDTNIITGWSDKIFTIMDSIENGGEVLDEIKEIQI